MIGVSTNQVVIWSNTKQFSEVTEGNWSICLKTKVAVVMSRSQVTAFTETHQKERDKDHHENLYESQTQYIHSVRTMLPTWGKRCFRPPQSLA